MMPRGKYYSLEEAREGGNLKRFAKEHPSTGSKSLFDKLLNAMAHGESPPGAKKRPKGSQT